MNRYICIHGHSYQPPRENPWLEAIELQDSAYPYHDWNERITAECYAPNAASRILDGDGRIEEIVNSYARISFNFGPTLLSWLEANAGETYEAILEADRRSLASFSGHGSAIAQPYNHVILPLATRRDKRTQIAWGLRDFERRFGRPAEGAWLPETAVDLETLEILAAEGVAFTILAQHQLRGPRLPGEETEGQGAPDPTRPYRVPLRGGRHIDVFLYDGQISQAIAFQRLLSSGERFAEHLMGAFSDERDWPQLVSVATDGETYGHHFPHGDMALAYALRLIESRGLARITNYGEFLAWQPPTHEASLVENTSWSCVHGIERWRSDCGCDSGGHGDWNQEWRRPLREALEWLRDQVDPLYADAASGLLRDPWIARDAYIDVILAATPQAIDAFLAEHAARPLDAEEISRALRLLELQRFAQLMFTSCGWFFDEISGLETVQVIRYAARVLHISEGLFDRQLEEPFLVRLAAARSNLPEHGDGRQIYEKWARPGRVDLMGVGAHHVLSALFAETAPRGRVFSFTVEREDERRETLGVARLALGRIRVTSERTRETAVLSYGAICFGEHSLAAGLRPFRGEEQYGAMVEETAAAFRTMDFPEALRCIDRHFGGATYSLRSLFRDEQRRVLDVILAGALADAEQRFRRVYEAGEPIMRHLTHLNLPVPRAFEAAAEIVVNRDLRACLEADEVDALRVRAALERARDSGVALDTAGLERAAQNLLDRLVARLRASPMDAEALASVDGAVSLVLDLPFTVDPWRAQNACFAIVRERVGPLTEAAQAGDAGAVAQLERLRHLADRLRIRME